MNNGNDRIVMTPIVKEVGRTVLRMERKQVQVDQNLMHEAGGVHKGIVINKKADDSDSAETTANQNCNTSLVFKVFLVNAQTSVHTQESRQLRFWFMNVMNDHETSNTAQQFFRDLVNPSDFPRDYVGYIMKIMKMLQSKYTTISQMEVEMKQVQEISQPPSRPTSPNSSLYDISCRDRRGSGQVSEDALEANLSEELFENDDESSLISPDDTDTGSWSDVESYGLPASPSLAVQVSVDEAGLAARIELTEQRVLELIESSYPNAVSLEEMASATKSKEEEVYYHVCELQLKGLIKVMDNGLYARVVDNDTEVKVVKQMPKVVRAQQPTIAIITAQFCEKLAVDAMIDNKDTYMRYKTEGESNVWTLGNIGQHRVVSTKLPAIGHSREAMTAAGNTTTRLLGTFQRVEYVILVGLGGGVPHFTDYHHHVRLGDVVISTPPYKSAFNKPYIYLHCDKFEKSPEHRASSPSGEVTIDSFNYRTWCPVDLQLQDLSRDIYESGIEGERKRTWETYINRGLDELHDQEMDFSRPGEDSDKLYMSIGTKDVIEVGHPQAPAKTNDYDPRAVGMPKVHFGAIASGRAAVKDERLRQDVATKFGIKAFDSEFDTVAESVFGNRKEKYVFIRGISDYKDGTRKKDWQPFAALAAAAFMRTLIEELPPFEA